MFSINEKNTKSAWMTPFLNEPPRRQERQEERREEENDIAG
ncbi:hypothetical protein [Microseira sp. BLCC-F43]|jgi:hypothetical protein